jgi:Ca2+-binding EF-hand superfamily protein
MGCGDSKVMTVETRNDLAKLQLSSSQIDTFLAAFHKIDRNNSGFINIKEFIDTLKIERTIASEEVFEDMDFTHDGRISFREFTLLIWRFCTRGLESIAEFAFDIYDTDNSQELTQDEIKEMILETHGKLTDKHNVSIIILLFLL